MGENKRIVKNTMALYVRMAITMSLGLVSSRYILKSLGVVDFGIYNVVGSIVTMFTFLNGSMAASVSRYLTFQLGKGDEKRLREVFATSMITHIALAALVVLLSETIGIWFLYNKMIIPNDRLTCAFWVLQMSILSSVFTIISVPYNSLVIAHERMGTFALITTLDSVLKFTVAVLLIHAPGDHLLLYAICIMGILILDRFAYQFYCIRHFKESRWHFFFEKKLFKEMFSFAGWSLSGNIAIMCLNTGSNMLLNTFFGPIVNTARGISQQVNGAISSFYCNFQMALMPQITKEYAKGELTEMHKLIGFGTRMSFLLLFIVALPIFIYAPFILELWLGQIPKYSVSFFRIIVLISLIGCMSRPLVISIHATGNIKKFQMWESSTLLLTLPISYLLLCLGLPPITVFVVQFIIEALAQIIRISIVLPEIGYSIKLYITDNILPVCYVAIISAIFAVILCLVIKANSIVMYFISIFAILLFTAVSSYYIGLNRKERSLIISYLKNKIKK